MGTRRSCWSDSRHVKRNCWSSITVLSKRKSWSRITWVPFLVKSAKAKCCVLILTNPSVQPRTVLKICSEWAMWTSKTLNTLQLAIHFAKQEKGKRNNYCWRKWIFLLCPMRMAEDSTEPEGHQIGKMSSFQMNKIEFRKSWRSWSTEMYMIHHRMNQRPRCTIPSS